MGAELEPVRPALLSPASFEDAMAHFAYEPDTGVLVRRRTGQPTGTVDTTTGYMRTWFVDGTRYVHRVIMLWMTGVWPEQHVDHINGHRTDNRWANLRLATASLNAQNLGGAKRSNHSSGLLGAYRTNSRINPWMARITANGVDRYLGSFSTAEDAHHAYLAAKSELHPNARRV